MKLLILFQINSHSNRSHFKITYLLGMVIWLPNSIIYIAFIVMSC